MTALLDLHPDPGHPGAVVAGVRDALDGLGGVELDPGEYAAVVTDVDRAVRRLEALKLRLVAAAERADVPRAVRRPVLRRVVRHADPIRLGQRRA